MKYKVLLMGNNNTIIDDFFVHMDDVFEVQFSSSRYEDLLSHIKYFQPDILVYCMDTEFKETMSRTVSIKNKFSKNELPLAVIGDEEDCSAFHKVTAGIADLVIRKPVTVKGIRERIIDLLKKTDEKKEKEKERERVDEEQKRLKEEERKRKDAEINDILASLEAGEFGKKHILVVDDDVRMLKVIKEHLRGTYDVATAINGKLALKFLETKSTDLILLDYVMPDEDGPAVLKKIHENPATKDIPVIFLTGMTERGKIQEALSERPQGYLLKPIARDKLLSTIQSVIH